MAIPRATLQQEKEELEELIYAGRGSATIDAPYRSLIEYLAISNLVPRLVFSSLLGTGLLCATYAVSASYEFHLTCSTSNTFECENTITSLVFPVAVNAIAAFHYWEIMKLRRTMALRNVFMREAQTDELRHGDWAVTLIFLYIHLHEVAKSLSKGAAPPLFSPGVAAGLQPLLVFFGWIGRGITNELRSSSWASMGIGVFAYGVATAIFALTQYNLCAQIFDSTYRTARSGDNDRSLLAALVLVQIGYPITTGVQIVWLRFTSESETTYSMRLSVVKDIAYGGLDLVSKGGVAFFAFKLAVRDAH
jgi:hypothetical protein